MTEAAHPDEAVHARIVAAAQTLQPTKSRLRNGISSHRVGGPVAFPVLDSFTERATAALASDPERRLFLGSVDGDLYVSVQVRARADADADAGSEPKRKRQRDDCAERAENAVADIRKRVRANPLNCAMLAAVDVARDVIEQLLRTVKGAHREEVVESCGLSMAAGPHSSASSAGSGGGGSSERPRLIIAARLSAGVPMPLLALKRALGPCFKDGMVTTQPESLGPAYQLPLSAAGKAVEQAGQRSLLLFAAVPILAVAAATTATAVAPAATATPNK